jgi:hypothetical protein
MVIAQEAGDMARALDDALYFATNRDSISRKVDRAVVTVWELGRHKEADALSPIRAVLEGYLTRRPYYVGWWIRAAHLQFRDGDAAAARRSVAEGARWSQHPRSRLNVEYPRLFSLLSDLATAVADLGDAEAAQRVAGLVAKLERRRRSGATRP